MKTLREKKFSIIFFVTYLVYPSILIFDLIYLLGDYGAVLLAMLTAVYEIIYVFWLGRKENVMQNIVFKNCEFTQIPFEEVDDGENHGSLFHHDKEPHPLEIRFANVNFINTKFILK